jgi:hypothetical protein
MNANDVLSELALLANERVKKRYVSLGAREPLFGVATGAMKPLFRRIRKDQALAEALYATGNFDAMYFAGMIADPDAMRGADFDRWMETAYFPMLYDFVVAVTLAEAACAQPVADRWLTSGDERFVSAGWSCFEWLLGWKTDAAFDPQKIRAMLSRAQSTVAAQSAHLREVIVRFVAAVGVSYLPLHAEALAAAEAMDTALAAAGGDLPPSAAAAIRAMADRGKIGFKRRAVRC